MADRDRVPENGVYGETSTAVVADPRFDFAQRTENFQPAHHWRAVEVCETSSFAYGWKSEPGAEFPDVGLGLARRVA